MADLPRLLILTGTTASGKSSFLYRHLRDLPLTIINADSRQVYTDLRISSASPTLAEREIFAHELYNYLEPERIFSAGQFVREARAAIARAIASGTYPVICGGTYFYIQSLLEGLLPEIEVPERIRLQVEQLTDTEAWEMFSGLDPVAAAKVHRHNRVRVNRQLALCLAHEGPISSLARDGGITGLYEILMLIFLPEREDLRTRVAERVGQMFDAGIVAEANSAVGRWLGQGIGWREVPAYTGIGIREFFEVHEETGVLPGKLTETMLAGLRERIIRNTMQLVKRQMTWFRNAASKPPFTKTVDPLYEHELIAALARDFLQVNVR